MKKSLSIAFVGLFLLSFVPLAFGLTPGVPSVPEPVSLFLLGSGLIGLWICRKIIRK